MCGRINTIDGRTIGPGDYTNVYTSQGIKELKFGADLNGFNMYNRRIEKLDDTLDISKKIILPFDSFQEKGTEVYPNYSNIFLGGLIIGDQLDSFAIITKRPDVDFMNKVHHRRPIIVTRQWLTTEITHPDEPRKAMSLEPKKHLDEAVTFDDVKKGI